MKLCVDNVALSLTINLQDISTDGTDLCHLQSLLEHMGSLTYVDITPGTNITTSALQSFMLAAGPNLRNRLLELCVEPADSIGTTA